MADSNIHPGIHEVHSFEVDEFDYIRGIVCGGQMLSQAGADSAARQLQFAEIFSDARTRALYDQLVTHVRTTSETISFPYRCDNETHCIYLRAVVLMSSSRRVGFHNKITGYDPRPVGTRLLRTFVTQHFDYKNCSICNRLSNDPHTGWHEFQALVETGQWPCDGQPMRCAFDICDDCDMAVKQRLSETLRSFDRRAT